MTVRVPPPAFWAVLSFGLAATTRVGAAIPELSATGRATAVGPTASAPMTARQFRLSVPILLPVALVHDGDWLITTNDNQIGLLNGERARWWLSIDSALFALPAFVVVPSIVGIMLRSGVLELHHRDDGAMQQRIRLPLTDCASTAAYYRHVDGSLTVACGNGIVRVASTGQVISSSVLAESGCDTLSLVADIAACASGMWFWNRRWRGPSPIVNARSGPLLTTSTTVAFPFWALLRDARVLRFDDYGTWAFEPTSTSGDPRDAQTIAAQQDGGWLALDGKGTITWHAGERSGVVGSIGPPATALPQARARDLTPQLASFAGLGIVAGWPEGPLHLLRGATRKVLEDSNCSEGGRQVMQLDLQRLLVACGDGRLTVFVTNES